MTWMRWGKGIVLAGLLASTGCCWWCDRWCPRSAACQPCAPVCCGSSPAYIPATAYSAPQAPPAVWNQPGPAPAAPVAGRPPLYYSGNGCYCEQPPRQP